MQVTHNYVRTRFAQFVERYKQVLESLGFDSGRISADVANLENRLAKDDFKLYGTRPVNYLHAGKRITRFYIKLALEMCPKYKDFKERLRKEYAARATEIRKRSPDACFFSFESTYAKQLRVDFKQHRKLFFI